MLDTPTYLGGTSEFIGAHMGSLSLDTHKRRTTYGTLCDKFYRHRTWHSCTYIDTGNLGNNLATLLHIEMIAFMYVETAYNIGIMERGTLYDSA